MFAFSGISPSLTTAVAAASKGLPTGEFPLFFERQLKPDDPTSAGAEVAVQPPQPAQQSLRTVTAIATETPKLQPGLQVTASVPTALPVEPGTVQSGAPAHQPTAATIPTLVSDNTAPESVAASALAAPSATLSPEPPNPADEPLTAAAVAPAPPTAPAWIWEDWHWSQQAGQQPRPIAARPASTDTQTVVPQAQLPDIIEAVRAVPAQSTARGPLPASMSRPESTSPASPPVVTVSEDLPQPAASENTPTAAQPLAFVLMAEIPTSRSQWPVSLPGMAPTSRAQPLTFSVIERSGPELLQLLIKVPAGRPETGPAELLSTTLALNLDTLLESPAHPLFFRIQAAAASPDYRLVAAQHSRLSTLPDAQALGAEIRRQLGLQSIKAILQQSQQSLRVQLEPAWLGKMTLQVQRGQQGLQIQIFADHLLTRELLDAQSGLLRQQLSDLGLIIASLRIGQSSPEPDTDDHERGKDSEVPWHWALPHSRGQPAFQLDAGSLSGLPAESGKSLPEMSLIHFVV